MTSSLERRLTIGQMEERTPEGQREMAASRIMVRATSLIDRAFELSGCTQRELAEILGVTEGRVSQVLHGNGNIKLSTLARYLRAMGYQVDLKVDPAEESVAPLDRPRRRTRRDRTSDDHDVWGSVVEHDGQQSVKMTFVPNGVPLSSREVSSPKRIGIANTRGRTSTNGAAHGPTDLALNFFLHPGVEK